MVINEYRIGWQRWRTILDKIIANPGYRYGHKNVALLLRLAHFAQNELAHFNTQYWRKQKDRQGYILYS